MYRNFDFTYDGPPRRREYPFTGAGYPMDWWDPFYGPGIGDFRYARARRPLLPRAPHPGITDRGTQLALQKVMKAQGRILQPHQQSSETPKRCEIPKNEKSGSSNSQKIKESDTQEISGSDVKNESSNGGECEEEKRAPPSVPIGPRIPAKEMWENSYREKVSVEAEIEALDQSKQIKQPELQTQASPVKRKQNKNQCWPYHKRKKKNPAEFDSNGNILNADSSDSSSLGFPKKCKPCNVQLSREEEVESHYNGEMHRKNINKSLAGNETKLDEINKSHALPINTPECHEWGPDIGDRSVNTIHFCRLCSVRMTSLPNARQHYEGKSHAKRIRIVNRGDRPHRKPFKPACFVSGGVLGMPQSTLSSRNALNYEVPSVPTVTLGTSVPTEFVHSMTPSGQYYCQTCNVVIELAANLSPHLQSREHKRAKARSRF